MRPDIVPGGTFPDYEPPDPMIPHTLVLKPGLVIHGWDGQTAAMPRPL
jgi:hypothetical protein